MAEVTYNDSLSWYIWRNAARTLNIRMWVPRNAHPVRGVIINFNHGGGDTRDWVKDGENAFPFGERLGFALAGTYGFTGGGMYGGQAQEVIAALNEFAALGWHPELANAAVIAMGHSNGSMCAYGFTCAFPARTLCFTADMGPNFTPSTPSDAAIRVPGMLYTGEIDDVIGASGTDRARAMLSNVRSRGGLWSWANEQGVGHGFGSCYQINMTFWEHCIAVRYPQGVSPLDGPVTFNAIAESSGWLASEQSWYTGAADIAPWAQYAGTKSQAMWLLDSDIACLYRGAATYNKPCTLSVQGDTASIDPWLYWQTDCMVYLPSTRVTLAVASHDTFANWDRVAFFRGADSLGQITSGSTFSFTVSGSAFDYYAITAVAYRGAQVRPMAPVHFMVTGPSTGVQYDRTPRVAPAVCRPPSSHRFDMSGRLLPADRDVGKQLLSGVRLLSLPD
jgi:hypothetical protein